MFCLGHGHFVSSSISPDDLDPKVWDDLDPDEVIRLRVPYYDEYVVFFSYFGTFLVFSRLSSSLLSLSLSLLLVFVFGLKRNAPTSTTG